MQGQAPAKGVPLLCQPYLASVQNEDAVAADDGVEAVGDD